MKCPYCNNETPDNLTFCSRCGRNFDLAPKKKESHIPVVVTIIIAAAVFFSVSFAILFSNTDRIKRHRSADETTATVSPIQTAVADIKATETPVETTEKEEKDDAIYSVVEEPKYIEKQYQMYGINISYPEHFREIANEIDDNNTIIQLEDTNNAAMVQYWWIEHNGASVSDADYALNEALSEDDITIIDEKYDDVSIYKKYRLGDWICIIKGIKIDKYMCLMSFVYAEFESHVYEKYYDYMSNHFYALDDKK